MTRTILMAALLAVGIGAGAFGALELRSPPEARPDVVATDLEYVRLPRQITVPIWENGTVRRVVAVEVTLVVPQGLGGVALAAEPRLRANLLSGLITFAHERDLTATDATSLGALGRSLLAAAEEALPGAVQEVLVTDLFVQEM